MISVFAGLALFVLALLAALVLAPQRRIETEIGIDAPPEKVWAVLAATGRYGEWNPFVRSIEGELAVGARLTNRLRMPKGGEMTFRPVVLACRQPAELRWLGRLGLPRLFDGEHYFLLEPAGAGTRFVHGERFQGILLWFMDLAPVREGFEAMNAALKARVEGA